MQCVLCIWLKHQQWNRRWTPLKYRGYSIEKLNRYFDPIRLNLSTLFFLHTFDGFTFLLKSWCCWVAKMITYHLYFGCSNGSIFEPWHTNSTNKLVSVYWAVRFFVFFLFFPFPFLSILTACKSVSCIV